jgi:MFS family permease
MATLYPQQSVSDNEREGGLRALVREAAFSGGTSALTGGVILTAFAIHLGASNIMVGILASAPFLTQLLQLPAIVLVERLRTRKRIAVLTSALGRLMLVVMAITAFFASETALWVFLAAVIILCGLSAIGGCAWSAWIRDLAPENRLGQVFSRRTAWTTAIGLVLGLAAALILDRTAEGSTARATAFAAMFSAGCITGLISAWIVAGIPEPQMAPMTDRLSLIALVRAPLADRNFRSLLRFMASWQFAVNLATPFFTVFIVRQLRFDISVVMVLSVASQVANLVVIRIWGLLADRFANKSVLAVAAPAYILCITAMAGASQFEDRHMILAWLVMLHILMGASVAGVTLGTTNIALKLSPKGSATAYVAVNAMITALAAGVAPIIGGLLADFFAARQLEFIIRWTGPKGSVAFPVVLTHWDFYFLLAGMIGFYAMHRLTLVAEHGEIHRREMVNEVIAQTRRTIRNFSSVAGLRVITEMPASLLHDARLRIRLARMRAGRQARDATWPPLDTPSRPKSRRIKDA